MKEDTIRVEGSVLPEQQSYKSPYQSYRGITFIGQQTYYEIYKDLGNNLREFVSATPFEWLAKDVCERYGYKYETYYVAVEA